MIKGDAQRLQTDGRQLPQIHRILAKDARIHSLIEVNAPLDGTRDRDAHFAPRSKAQVADLRDDLLEIGTDATTLLSISIRSFFGP